MITIVRRNLTLLLATALLTLVSACGDDSAQTVPVMPSPVPLAALSSLPAAPKLVILISIDTLRADHLGCYGYDRPTSPAFDAFAEGAVIFRQAVAHAPSTLPSHASMLTSLLPEHHGAFYARRTALAQGIPTLASVLANNGFTTAAFTGGGQLAPEFGLTRGFDLYDSVPVGPRFSDTVSSAFQWLDDTAPPRAFLFLHTFEVHHPYTPPADLLALFSKEYDGPLPRQISTEILLAINQGETVIDESDLAHIIAAYDAEIRSVDAGWQALQSGLEERGVLDDALIVFTADHGEEFNEHGIVGWHSHTLFDELLLVPLVMRFPQGWGGGDDVLYQVRSIDITPTVVAALGLEAPDSFEGISLLPFIGGSAEDPGLAALSQQDNLKDVRFVSIRHRSQKLIPRLIQNIPIFDTHGLFDKMALHLAAAARPYMLFNLDEDPEERHDLSLGAKEQIRRLQSIDKNVSSARAITAGPEVELASETAERLRALGYITDGQ